MELSEGHCHGHCLPSAAHAAPIGSEVTTSYYVTHIAAPQSNETAELRAVPQLHDDVGQLMRPEARPTIDSGQQNEMADGPAYVKTWHLGEVQARPFSSEPQVTYPWRLRIMMRRGASAQASTRYGDDPADRSMSMNKIQSPSSFATIWFEWAGSAVSAFTRRNLKFGCVLFWQD